MTRRPRTLPVPARRRAATGAVLLTGALALSACGSDDADESTGASSGPPEVSAAEMDAYLESTAADASAIADDVVAEYQASGAYPESADGLGTLSEGNEIGGYEPSETNAEICVEHVVDGEAVAFTSWYVDAVAEPVRSNQQSSGENTGCL